MLHRLAIRLGYTSIRRLVDDVPHDELDKFLAVEYLEGDAWSRAAWLSMQIRNTGLVIAAKCGKSVHDDEIKPAYAYLPEYLRPEKKPPQTAASQSLDTWMRQAARKRHG